jgi:hypothetical protein
MPEIKPRRGRPKGSGIDDRSRLRQLASLLRDKPDLKPTTAIRALGIKDPSAIRRLRDKFHLCRSELMIEIGQPAPIAPSVTVAAVRPARAAAPAPVRRALAAAQAAPAKTLAPVRPAVPRAPEPAARAAEVPRPLPAPEPAPAARRARELDRAGGEWMTAWCGLGLQAMTSAVAAQVEFTQQVVRLPPLTAALRHHLALSELAFALYASGARVAAAR